MVGLICEQGACDEHDGTCRAAQAGLQAGA